MPIVKAGAQASGGSGSNPDQSGLIADQRVVPPPAFTSSVWGIHDAQRPHRPIPTGCGFYRVVLPLEQLKAHGWDCRWQAFTPPPEVGEYKMVVAERLDKPDVLGSWRRLKLGHTLVYEIDDDIWSVDMANTNAHAVYRRDSVQDAVENACRTADLVTVTCETLAEVVRRQSGQENIAVLPNCIPESMLSMERKRNSHVTIGWTGGASHTWDVSMIAHPVRDVMNRDSSLRLHIQGVDFRPTFGLPFTARFTEWEENPRDYYRHLDFDIALAPLYPTAFAASKSYLKALEYAALGIPVIASDFGPYKDFIIDGVTGFLVTKEKQWRDRIRELAADSGLRETMGAKARELAAQHTIEKNWVKWAAAYEGVLR